MSDPLTASLPSHGSLEQASEALQHSEALEQLRKDISNVPELQSLLPALQGHTPKSENEDHLSFACLFNTIRQLPEFEERYQKDVPDQFKGLIEAYAAATPQEPIPITDPNVLCNMDSASPLPHSHVLHSPEVISEVSKLASYYPSAAAAPEPRPRWSESLPLPSEPLPLPSDPPQPSGPLPQPSIPLPPSPMFHHLMTSMSKKLQSHPGVLEGDGKPMKWIPKLEFQNWGLTVTNTPSDTFVARTEVGLCNLVQWASQKKKRVRVAGYRHTWTDFYSSDDEVLVMLLPIEALTEIPSAEPTMQEIQKNSDLVGIKVASSLGTTEKAKTALCTVKAGTTNEMFRRWCLENRCWALPINIIMVEITFGGSNGPICHGSGFSTTTLSDLVAEFHYVDPKGIMRSVSDPEELRAASGCFGLLGICTAVTLRLDAMAMAVMNPVKLPVPLAIPPPPGFQVPWQISMEGITEEKLKKAQEEFERRCEEEYYLEWFWFPLTSKVWVNTWKKVEASTTTLSPYPTAVDAAIQWAQGWAAQVLISSKPFKWLSGWSQTFLLAHTALSQLPDLPKPEHAINTLVSEALHFRRGVQNMRCLDSEWEIPISESAKSPGKRNYGQIQQAWWDAIKLFYDREDYAMRLTLEMRLTGGSQVLLAPQRGNDLGTISIEVITTLNTPPKDWASFLQAIADKWTNYCDKDGVLVNARPHWAKEWKGLTVHGQPIETYLRETAYKDAIPEFRAAIAAITKARDSSIEETRERFGNPLLERMLFTT